MFFDFFKHIYVNNFFYVETKIDTTFPFKIWFLSRKQKFSQQIEPILQNSAVYHVCLQEG